MFNSKHKEIRKSNRIVYKLKKKQVKLYKKALDSYINQVSELAINVLNENNSTHYDGEIISKDQINNVNQANSIKLGILLNEPPQLGYLSLPAFLGYGSKFDTDNQELIKLNRGYLYIHRDKNSNKFSLDYHLEKPDTMNPYLDAGKSFKSELPNLIRDNGLVTTQLYLFSRIFSLIKLL